ncbi:MAG: site-specific DNA-methyltransferase, partial [Nanoarchaeota archaeon]
ADHKWGMKSQGENVLSSTEGRFPANIIFDEESAKVLDEQSGVSKSVARLPRKANNENSNTYSSNLFGQQTGKEYSDKGGASRFFYVAKASKSERNFGLDGYITIKLIKQENIESLWKKENMELVQLLLKDILGLGVESLSIEESGENILVRFQKDTLSTIRTEIKKIIELKTWNSLTHWLTKEYILDVFLKKEDGLNHVEFVKNLKKLVMKTGISQEKVGSVMEDVKNATYQLLLILNEKEEKDFKENKNFHPTVKSLKLMKYLIKMVTKEGAIVLDPFIGSGTTAIACLKTNRNFIGIEKESDYIKIAEARLKPYLEQKKF